MQVILGAGGVIGNELAKELKKYTDAIRLVARNPQKINENDELFKADLLDKSQVIAAVEGAEVAYLTVGLPYKAKVWQKQWPVIMQNTISACKRHRTKLVFFDNIYMYHSEMLDGMVEETEVHPVSKKGKVRAQIAQMLFNELSGASIKALIARSADFYGPGTKNSIFNEVVVKNLKAGKKANWFCSLNYNHNFTYTPDAAKATALLGNTESAFGQIWHLPTAAPKTGKQWIEAVAKELDVVPKSMIVPKFMVQVLGIFNPVMKEFVEMLYQFDRNYDFDSSKFETVFNFKPTLPEEAIRAILKAD